MFSLASLDHPMGQDVKLAVSILTRTILLAAGLIIITLGTGFAEVGGFWASNQGNALGWQLMTQEERLEHQTKMHSFKTDDECKTYPAKHHERSKARTKKKCCDPADGQVGRQWLRLSEGTGFSEVNDDASPGNSRIGAF